ncbi:MAG: phosphatidylinositol-specific phospholipase C1-like protein [Sphingomonas sp.]
MFDRHAVRLLTALLCAAGSMLALAPPAQAARCRLDAASATAAGPGCADRWMDRNLRVNDLLTVGTHNSYKQAIPPADYRIIAAHDPVLAEKLDYAHKSLTAQLNAGAREIEVDVVYDPLGGRYASPLIARMTHAPLDASWLAAMRRPGFKVIHVPDADFRSSCVTFKDCLGLVKAWSQAHPRHVPITILINAKQGETAVPGRVPLLPFDAKAFDALDREIREVLPPSMLLTPDDVQGRYPTLREAVLHDNWPRLGRARGRIMFALDESPKVVALYRGPRHSLEGRAMFVNAPTEQSPAAAYLTLNDAARDTDRIARDVRAGFWVRTRADSDTFEARRDDIAHRDLALRTGAQAVSTDYLWADPRFPGRYTVRLPDHAASICNPVRARGKCGGLAVETASDADWRAAETAPLVTPAPRAGEAQP